MGKGLAKERWAASHAQRPAPHGHCKGWLSDAASTRESGSNPSAPAIPQHERTDRERRRGSVGHDGPDQRCDGGDGALEDLEEAW